MSRRKCGLHYIESSVISVIRSDSLTLGRMGVADTLTSIERSKRMSLIRSKNTRPELKLRRALHAKGYRYHLHKKELPGKPDIVFTKRRLVIFINGCFWHGHKCPIGHVPKSNSEFWRKKIAANRKRDAKNICKLRALGWKVVNVWECSLISERRFLEKLFFIDAILKRHK